MHVLTTGDGLQCGLSPSSIIQMLTNIYKQTSKQTKKQQSCSCVCSTKCHSTLTIVSSRPSLFLWVKKKKCIMWYYGNVASHTWWSMVKQYKRHIYQFWKHCFQCSRWWSGLLMSKSLKFHQINNTFALKLPGQSKEFHGIPTTWRPNTMSSLL